jgi:tRNA A-37 threonylcarbamoyl transferase component Bud32
VTQEGAPNRSSSSSRRAPAQLGPGDVVASTTIVEAIGHGGMGAVFRARDALGRDVALKVIREDVLDPEVLARFRREGEALARVPAHRNVLHVHSAGVENGRPYLVLEYVAGETLRAALGRGPLAIDRAVAIGAKLARALAHAHQAGVLHRDLKPANIQLRAEDGEPVVMDFGLAALRGGDRLTRTGDVLGTPSYMAPEQALGLAVDARTDVHALGVILHELLTGEVAFPGTSAIDVIAKVTQPGRPSVRSKRAEVDQELDQVVARAGARDPEARTPSAEQLARELEAWLARGKPRRSSRLVPALVVAVVVVGAGVAFALREPPPSAPAPIVAAPAPPAIAPKLEPPRSHADLVHAAEQFHAGDLAKALARARPEKGRLQADLDLEEALVRGLASVKGRPRAVLDNGLAALGDVAFSRGGPFEKAAAAALEEAVQGALDEKNATRLVSLVESGARLGLRFADAKAGDQLLDLVYARCLLPHAQHVDLERDQWGRILAAFVAFDVDVDPEHLNKHGLRAPSLRGEPERYLDLRLSTVGKDELDTADERAYEELLRRGELGPRTRAHVVALLARKGRLPLAERVALLRHASERLDPDSPIRALELARLLVATRATAEAIEACRAALARFERIGGRAAVSGDEDAAREILGQLERGETRPLKKRGK